MILAAKQWAGLLGFVVFVVWKVIGIYRLVNEIIDNGGSRRQCVQSQIG